MNGIEHPGVVVKQPYSPRWSATQLLSPPQSPDSILRSRTPEVLERRAHRHMRSVHWSKEVIDNEHKRSVRPSSPIPYTPKIPTSSESSSQSQKHLNQVMPFTNSPSRVTSSPSKGPEFMDQYQPSMNSPSEWKTATRNIKNQVENVLPRREPGLLIESPAGSKVCILGQVVDEHREGAPSVMKRELSRPPSGNKSSNPKQLFSSRITPTLDPDSPQRLLVPPPTPRPARLPSPDLPDISRREFCGCHGSNCNHSHGKGKRPMSGKKHKKDAAKARIGGGKK